MKFIALLFVTLLAVASCKTFFWEKFTAPQEESSWKRNDIINFFEGVFSYFNLSSPSQIHHCFCDSSAGLYFKSLQELGEIFKDTKERNSFELHLEYGKIWLFAHGLKDTHACIAMTQDFTDLLDALKIKERNPHVFKWVLYFYYQAHYIDLFEAFQPVLENLNIETMKTAGAAYGAVLNDTVQTIKQEGLYHIAYAGFGNGGAIALDIDEPNDSLQCFDNKASESILEFIYKMSAAVAEGNVKEGPLNAIKFVHEEGQEILKNVPLEAFQCQASSEDTQKISKAIGMDMTQNEFHDILMKYIFDHSKSYYDFSTRLKKAFENGNLHHAGSIYYRFLKKVASSK